MSLQPNAAIASIGAVYFDNSKIINTFYQTTDLVDCQRLGLHIDANTIYFWLQQSNEAKNTLLTNSNSLAVSLQILLLGLIK